MKTGGNMSDKTRKIIASLPVEKEPKTYEECLAEIRALRADPEYDNWTTKRPPSGGRKLEDIITPEMLRMSDEEIRGWADKASRLFSKEEK